MVSPNCGPIEMSVIVPIYNRASDLPRLFAALALQTFPRDRFEVIVSDDGSEPPLESVVVNLAKEYGLPVRYIHQAHQGPGAARNAGLALAQGEIVAFIDSDTIPEPDWLAAYHQAFLDQEIDLAGGEVCSAPIASLWSQAFNFLMSSSIGSAGARDPRALIRQRYYPRGGNMAVRRHYALSVGGFRSGIVAEDLDFSLRLLAAGAKLAFVPEARVIHYEQTGWRKVAIGCFRRGFARNHLQRRYRLWEWKTLLPAGLVLYLLAASLAAIWQRDGWLLLVGGLSLYGVLLLSAGMYAAWRLKRFALVLIVPVCASLMHIAFGFGWLFAWCFPLSRV